MSIVISFNSYSKFNRETSGLYCYMAILPLASLKRAMPTISYLILPAHYGYSCLCIVCGLSCLLLLPIHCMRLILPAHYGYSCLWLVPKERCRSLLSSLVKRVCDTQRSFLRVATVPSAYYCIPIPALLIWVATVPGAYPYRAYLPTRYPAYLPTQHSFISI